MAQVMKGWMVSWARCSVHHVSRRQRLSKDVYSVRWLRFGRRGLTTASEKERGGGGGYSETFSTRFLALLKDGRADRCQDGLGHAGGREIAAARRALLEVMQVPEDQHLSPETVVSIFCRHYQHLGDSVEKKSALLAVLSGDLGVDHTSILSSAHRLTELHSENRPEVTLLKSESHLRHALSPFYVELFGHIARMEGGIKFLVDFRADLLNQLKYHGDTPSSFLLSEMSSHLQYLLSQWFSMGLMDVQQITWESPCDIMEKISQYEAVHPLRHWRDLKHRVNPNRRCFIFTHRALPREPIVVVHVALTTEPSSNVQALLNRSVQENTDQATTAVFYSISATQKGLSGIDLGHFLLRRVVVELQREFPDQLSRFFTLSPIPGFRRWLDSYIRQHLIDSEEPLLPEERGSELRQLFPEAGNSTEALQVALGKREWALDREGQLAAALKAPLASLCARYLIQKRRGKALDPVAHFHLSGGALIWKLNWLADVSPLGLQNSYGFMCNYWYHLPELSRNSDSYLMSGEIKTSDTVNSLL